MTSLSKLAAGASLLLVGCGPTYPNDLDSWFLVESPNQFTEEQATTFGQLTLYEDGGLAMLEESSSLSIPEMGFNGSIDIRWDGSWVMDGDVTTIDLVCTSVVTENVPEPFDCATETRVLSCTVVAEGAPEARLDCGDYSFAAANPY